MINKDLGMVTAYAYAVSKGYTGTEEEFAALMADYAEVGERAEAAATAAAASATAASGSASDSAASATAAEGFAENASASAGNASQAAQNASQSATAASGKATEATQAATAAETAKGAAQTAQATAETAAATAITKAAEAAASAAHAAEDAEEISSVKNALGATLITDTASGAIATFTDGSDGVPMESVVVSMEPIQDLHGQDAPYPGGGGKNLYSAEIGADVWTVFNGGTVTNDDGVLTVNMTSTLYSGCYSSVSSGSVIRALSTLNGTYSYSVEVKTSINTNVYIGFADLGNKSFSCSTNWTRITFPGILFTGTEASFNIYNGTTTACTCYIRNFQFESGSTCTDYAPYSNICPISGRSEVGVWREATYDTSADPALTIPLGQTVYGGTVDAVSGVMTVTHKLLALDDTNWTWKTGTWGEGYRYYTDEQVTDALNAQSCLSSIYPKGTYANAGIAIGNAITTQQVNVRIPSAYTEFDTLAKWTAYISENPVDVYYELATPVTVQLTAQQLTTLLGTNNVWSDGGNVSVEYVADTKAYIAKVIAVALA